MKLAKWTLTAVISVLIANGCSSTTDNSSEAQSFLDRADVYEQQGQYRAAMIEMRNALKVAPGSLPAIIDYAELLIAIGSASEAASLLSALDSSELSVLLAEAYLKMGKHVSASEQLAKATDASYGTEQLPRLSALLKFMQGDTGTALTELRKIASSSDTNLKATKDLINLLLISNNATEAEDWINSSLAGQPQDPDLLYYSAKVAFERDDLAFAHEQLTAALVELPDTDILTPIKSKALELMIEVLSNQGRATEALVYTNALQEASPAAFSARKQFQEGLEAASTGDLTAARNAFNDILVQFPNNQQAAILLGLINLEDGELEAGEALLSENLDSETAPISLVQATALAQAELGKADEALEMLDRALLARPDDPTLLSIIGLIALNTGDVDRGVVSLNKALQLAPERSRLHLLLAQHYNRDESPELALGHLRKAFSVSPTDWPITTYYITTLFNANEANEAKEVQGKLMASFSDNTIANWLDALIDYRLGETKAALKKLSSLYANNPTNNDISVSYANMLQQENQHDKAADVWLNTLNNNPGNRTFIEKAVRAKLVTTDRQGTLSWLSNKRSDYPEAELPIDAGLVQLHLEQKDLASAEKISSRYSNNQSPLATQMRVTTLKEKSIALAQNQDYSEALMTLEKAITLQPNNQPLTAIAAQLDTRVTSQEDALTRLETFIKTYKENATILSEKAKLLMVMKGDQEAYDFLQTHWAKQPQDGFADVFLTLTRRVVPIRLNDTIAELLEASPRNAMANLLQGDKLLAENNDQRAMEHYMIAVQSDPRLVPALNNLAWLIAQSNPSEAVKFSSRAAELAPNQAAVLDTHGWVLHLTGDRSGAIEVLTKALQLAPDNKEIQEHLAQAKS